MALVLLITVKVSTFIFNRELIPQKFIINSTSNDTITFNTDSRRSHDESEASVLGNIYSFKVITGNNIY